jgi:DNA-binding transcriptional LysR family regulator
MKWDSVCFDWNRTRAFLVTAEEGSLSAAAKALNMTQPTLSRQVAGLESELKVTLFERVGQRLELTQSGLELLASAKKMGEAAQNFSLVVSGQSLDLEGSVVVSVCELDAMYRLPSILAIIRKLEPGITIEVVVSNQASDLKRREADIAIRNFRPTQADLIAKKLGRETIWLYGDEHYLAPYQGQQNLNQMKNIQVIGFDQSTQVSDQLNASGWNLTKENFRLISAFQPLQVKLAEQGLGAIFLPEDVGDDHPKLVRAFPHLPPLMTLDVWLVCHQELRTNRRVKRVFDLISEHFTQYLDV